jgi:hypothetical protein
MMEQTLVLSLYFRAHGRLSRWTRRAAEIGLDVMQRRRHGGDQSDCRDNFTSKGEATTTSINARRDLRVTRIARGFGRRWEITWTRDLAQAFASASRWQK